jgi:hypothetical protein
LRDLVPLILQGTPLVYGLWPRFFEDTRGMLDPGIVMWRVRLAVWVRSIGRIGQSHPRIFGTYLRKREYMQSSPVSHFELQ